jgi:hypothetical protein
MLQALGITGFVIAGSELPSEFLAITLNVYEVPFFNPVIRTGLD